MLNECRRKITSGSQCGKRAGQSEINHKLVNDNWRWYCEEI